MEGNDVGRIVARELGVSERAARAALDTLETHGVLEQFVPTRRVPGRPRRWWVATELLALVNAWSR
jgi:predicted ArsR family transcriptional regulator